MRARGCPYTTAHARRTPKEGARRACVGERASDGICAGVESCGVVSVVVGVVVVPRFAHLLSTPPTYLQIYLPIGMPTYRPTYLLTDLAYLPAYRRIYLHPYQPTNVTSALPAYPPTHRPTYVFTYFGSWIPRPVPTCLTKLRTYPPAYPLTFLPNQPPNCLPAKRPTYLAIYPPISPRTCVLPLHTSRQTCLRAPACSSSTFRGRASAEICARARARTHAFVCAGAGGGERGGRGGGGLWKMCRGRCALPWRAMLRWCWSIARAPLPSQVRMSTPPGNLRSVALAPARARARWLGM